MSIARQTVTGIFMILALFASSVFAHSPLLNSNPAHGDTLATAPAALTLTFKSTVKLIKMQLEGPDLEDKLRPESAEPSTHFALPLPPLKAGSYSAAWRALGQDGHLMKGKIKFTVNP